MIMDRRLFVFVLAIFALALPCEALQLRASGTLDGGLTGKWSGRLELDHAAVTGQVALRGIPGMARASVNGVLQTGHIYLTLTANGKAKALFEGVLGDGTLLGTFTAGEQSGSWKGSWSVASGKALRSAPISRGQRNAGLLLEATAPSMHGLCDVLDTPHALGLMSQAARRTVLRACLGGNISSTVTPHGFIDFLRTSFRDIFPRTFTAPPVFAAVANSLVARQYEPTFNRTQGSPSVAIKRSNTLYLVSVYEDYTTGTSRRVGYSTSANAGAGWTYHGALSPASAPNNIAGQPTVASDYAGVFYVAYLGNPYTGVSNVYLSTSTDNGVTWGSTTMLPLSNVGLADRPQIVAGPTGDVFTCWTEWLGGGASTISFHGGASSGTQDLIIGTGAPYFADMCSISVQGNYVYVTWWNNLDYRIVMRRSSDMGATFGPVETIIGDGGAAPPGVDSCQGDPATRPVLNGQLQTWPYPSIAADPLTPDTTVYATWSHWDDILGDMQVLFLRSTGGGTTGTWLYNGGVDPGIVSASSTNDQFGIGVIASNFFSADPDITDVTATWYDRRRDTQNVNYDVIKRHSWDGGQTWQAEERQNNVGPLVLGQLNPHSDPEVEDCYFSGPAQPVDSYPVAAVTRNAWTDSRGLDDADIYFATPSSSGGGC